MMSEHCEFCDAYATTIHIPTYGNRPEYYRLSCPKHRISVRRLVVLDLGSGYTREYPGCSVRERPRVGTAFPQPLKDFFQSLPQEEYDALEGPDKGKIRGALKRCPICRLNGGRHKLDCQNR